MPLQTAVQLAQRAQLLFGDIADFGQRGVQHGRGMALRQDETVALGALRVVLVIVHDAAEVEAGDDICRRERTAGMAASGLAEHLDDVGAHMPCGFFYFRTALGNHAGTFLMSSPWQAWMHRG